MIERLKPILLKIKQEKPLILCLTNYVTMDFVANSLLALGAAPIMSECDDEIEELVSMSSAVCINIGTLENNFIKRCKLVSKIAKRDNKPLILDPVGAGASVIRTKTAKELLKNTNIVRGNASEIMSLAGQNSQTLGVESVNSTSQAKENATFLAKKFGCVVVVSGKEDFITDGKNNKMIQYGSPMMPLITGMGCSLTATIAAFNAILPNAFEASKLATEYFGLCGSLVQSKINSPSTFRTKFIDNLYGIGDC